MEELTESPLEASFNIESSATMYVRIKSWLMQGSDLPPEVIRGILVNLKIENVRMLDRYSKTPSLGNLFLTTTHLIFSDSNAKKETWVPNMHISTLEKLPLTTAGSPLHIRYKTFLAVTFVMARERDCHEVYTTLQALAQPAHIEHLYCFHYADRVDGVTAAEGWWTHGHLAAEYQRQGVPNDEWCLTTLNEDYELCDTYPKHLYVPATASKAVLIGSSRFRSKGRLPVLSYRHPNKASISRCSQPLSGFSARCVEDEQLLNHVLRTNPNATYMYVVDTRPKINAIANRAAGKGYENEAFYENIKFHFMGVENIHVMRNSLSKVVETCEMKNATMNSFLSGLESSGWLRHIKSVLDTSWFIAHAIESGISVVVHCSDGWDRTAQVCSLASLLLDPYYRTIKGYQALIEKDWLAFGHKFSERSGHIQSDSGSKEVSPVFTQLLDATWQLMQQRPQAFEFNERFLLTLHDHVHSCQYGTFVGNCQKDRLDLRLAERTYSLWGYMAKHENEYVNPLYMIDDTPGILTPILIPQNIKFWRGMYCRYESGVHPREPLGDLLLATLDHTCSLEDHEKYLKKRISTMKALLARASKKRKSKLKAALVAAAAQNATGSTSDPANNSTDNRYAAYYEKVAKELEAADHDHPLKVEKVQNPLTVEHPLKVDSSLKVGLVLKGHPEKENSAPLEEQQMQTVRGITRELESVALDWRTLRNISACSCSTPFDHFTRKYHCRKCGDVFCIRCINRQLILPGHFSQKNVPVCEKCYLIVDGSSLDSPV